MRLAAAAIAALLAACGQTGALYLPDEGVETPVEIRGPATSAPAPAPEPPPPTEEEDKDKNPGPLAGP
jgi:predicted small lipoprotein YifL